MKRAIEAILLIASIGGGFAGITVTLAEIFKVANSSTALVIIYSGAFAIYTYFIYAGLAFASNKAKTNPLKISFLLQILWLSSPILSYKMAAGFSLSGIIHSGGFNYAWNIGSDFNFGLLNGQPWGIGLNLAAILLYLLTARYAAKSRN